MYLALQVIKACIQMFYIIFSITKMCHVYQQRYSNVQYICHLEMRQSCVFHNTSEQYRLVELYDRLTDDQQIWSF